MIITKKTPFVDVFLVFSLAYCPVNSLAEFALSVTFDEPRQDLTADRKVVQAELRDVLQVLEALFAEVEKFNHAALMADRIDEVVTF